jgi:hypothetical protein
MVVGGAAKKSWGALCRDLRFPSPVQAHNEMVKKWESAP